MRQRKQTEAPQDAKPSGIVASDEGWDLGEAIFGKRPVLTAFAFVAITAIMLPVGYWYTTKSMYKQERKATHPPLHGSSDDTVVYKLAEGMVEPQPLSIPHLSMFIRDEVVGLDEAHLRGLYHHGAYIFVLDRSKRVLVLKRADNLKTCPGSWGLMGEHRRMEESFVMNVRRAIFEEVGPKVWGEVNLAQNLTHSPVYYRREYGPKLGNRVDRQLTSLWLVSVEPMAERIKLKPDNEMAAFKWVSLDELAAWLDAAPADFCDDSIVQLIRFGLGRLRAHPAIMHPDPIPPVKKGGGAVHPAGLA